MAKLDCSSYSGVPLGVQLTIMMRILGLLLTKSRSIDPSDVITFSMADLASDVVSKVATIPERQLMTTTVVSFCSLHNSSVKTE
jgi:hypothetical protein